MPRYYFSIILSLFLLITTLSIEANQPIKNSDYSLSNNGFFIENRGQLINMEEQKQIPSILYYSNSDNISVYLQNNSISYLFFNWNEEELNPNPYSVSKFNAPSDWMRIDMILEGANPFAKAVAEDKQSCYFNFYYPQCSDGVTKALAYKKVIIKDVYPLIDWVIYFSQNGNLKHGFSL